MFVAGGHVAPLVAPVSGTGSRWPTVRFTGVDFEGELVALSAFPRGYGWRDVPGDASGRIPGRRAGAARARASATMRRSPADVAQLVEHFRSPKSSGSQM